MKRCCESDLSCKPLPIALIWPILCRICAADLLLRDIHLSVVVNALDVLQSLFCLATTFRHRVRAQACCHLGPEQVYY